MDDVAKYTIKRMLALRPRFRYSGATSLRTESHRDGRWRAGHLPRWDKLWAKLVRAPNFAFIIMFLGDNFGNLPLRHTSLILLDKITSLRIVPIIAPQKT